MKIRKFASLAAAAFCSSSVPVLHAVTITYVITDLGTLGSIQVGTSSSRANAINSKGEIAGTATLSDGLQHAFLYNGSMHDLGSLRSGGSSIGLGINDAGTVVGKSDADQGLGDAFYYSGGRMTDMGTLPDGASAGSTAEAINASGTIVGVSYHGNGATNPNAFVYTGAMQDIGDLQGDTTSSYSGALGINNAGIVVGQGQLTTGDGTYVAFIYMGDRMTQLPTLPNQTGSTANAINSAGVVVGQSGDNGGNGASAAVMWTGGTAEAVPMIPGAIASEAFGINDAGQIVGDYVPTTGPEHAFVCTDGVCRDLNDFAAGGKLANFEYLAQANAISANGTIVGYGYRKNPNGGEYGPFAFMAKPSVPTSVPPAAGQGMLTVAQNDPAPGLGTGSGTPVFSVTGPPAIDRNGDVAFRATLKAASKSVPVKSTDDAGIWLYAGTVGSLVARTGDSTNPAPDTNGALFTKLGHPVLSSAGDLAFIGAFAGGPAKVHPTTGVFVKANGGGTMLAWAAGDPAPGITSAPNPVFAGFTEIAVMNGGGLAFLATVKGRGITPENNAGIWSADGSGDLQLLALKGTPLPGITPTEKITGLTAFKPLAGVYGQSRSIDTINGYGAILAASKSPSGIFLDATRGSSGYAITAGSMTGSNPNLSSFTLKSLDEPIVNENGSIAFLTRVAGEGISKANDSAIGLLTKNGGSLVLQTSNLAPDGAGSMAAAAVYSQFGDPVLDNADQYAFVGTLAPGIGDTARNGSNGSGIWTNFSGELQRVARRGDAAPGTAGSYATFEQLVLPDVGGPIFTASLKGVPASQAQGLWAVKSGMASLVVEAGNSLQVHNVAKRVKSFSIFQIPPSAMGQSRSFEATTGYLVYVATFTDGTWGIFSVLAG